MIATSADIRFECTQCGQRLVVESTAAGVASSCPICQSELTVPAKAGASPASVGHDHSIRPSRRKCRQTPAVQIDPPRADFGEPPLNHVRSGIGESDLRTAELARELAKASEEVSQLQHQLKAVTEECERLTASNTHTQAELKTFQGERQQSKSELSGARQRLAAAEMQLAARDQELAHACEAAAEWEALATTTDASLTEEHRLRVETFAELEQSREACAAAESAIERLTAEGAWLSRELSHSQGELQVAAETARQLAQTEKELAATQARLLEAETASRALAGKVSEIDAAAQALNRDLTASDAGRNLLDLRTRLATTETERDQTANRLATIEKEAAALKATEGQLRTELAETQGQRDESRTLLEAARESQVIKDNEVLRGIIHRQNSELAQNHRELHRFKRSRLHLKITYAIFGIGLLAVVALALIILTPVLR